MIDFYSNRFINALINKDLEELRKYRKQIYIITLLWAEAENTLKK